MVIVNKQNNIQLINNFLNQSIMKKSLFAILAVAACFASCSEVIESEVLDNPISFDNYVGKDAQTRASVLKTDNVKSVRVNACLRKANNTDPFLANFMKNQEVKWSEADQKWTYTPSKFWPAADQVVDFVSWVPVADYTEGETTKNNISVENATLTFTVPEEVKHQSDLLVAEGQMGLNRVTETTNAPVSLNYKHLLSRIGFEIIASGIPDDNVTVVELVEVTLNGNFASSGKVDMTKDNDPDKTNSTLAINTYDGGGTTKAYTLTGTHFGWSNNRITNAKEDPETEELVGVSNMSDSYIMLIPASNQPESIKVEYTITTDGDTASKVTNTHVFPLTGQYEAGKAYKYIFKITLQSITFDVKVEDWGNETTTDITPKDPNAQS